MTNHKATILLVDDEPAIHRMMQHIFKRAGYDAISVHSGEEALKTALHGHIDLVILDLSMPKMDGFQVAAEMKKHSRTKQIPIILFTGRDTVENHANALELGVDDFLAKTEHRDIILARVRLHLKLKRMHEQLTDYQHNLERKVAQQTRQLKNASLETIVKLAAASEMRDNETGAHILRMSHYAAAIAGTLGLGKRVVESILYSAPMHDVGKIGIPDSILLKPGPLTPEEWETMKKHPSIGADILSGAKNGFIKMAEMIALTHHEKWDGTGYPRGLKGKEIPLAGQIVAMADVFDALTSERPYKKAFSGVEAIRIIQEGRGSHLAPKVVDAFFTALDEILAIKERFKDTDADKKIPRVWSGQSMAHGSLMQTQQTASAPPNMDASENRKSRSSSFGVALPAQAVSQASLG
ncbi:MAG: response regulator [Desulfatibacillum sp.]|nr:response regulator [Desulfatibacillum sp.]